MLFEVTGFPTNPYANEEKKAFYVSIFNPEDDSTVNLSSERFPLHQLKLGERVTLRGRLKGKVYGNGRSTRQLLYVEELKIVPAKTSERQPTSAAASD